MFMWTHLRATLLIAWLTFLAVCFLPASALTITAPENRVWEILSVGCDAPTTEATDLENRTETSTSDYDSAPIHRAAIETKPTEAERTLFGPNAEFKAADVTDEEGASAIPKTNCFPKDTLGRGF
ncbi:MAG TPA: hypothetical protein VL981_13525 [Candidatus Methylacidiphilales bacterium]|nr:hypothetical protein [Candidatus Methylacidiphilales bacterium]